MVEYIGSILVTVISGVLVFILGQILQSIWLEPLQRYKQLKKEVAFLLSYRANVYTNIIDLAKADEKMTTEWKAVSHELRKLSCEIKGFIETLSFIQFGIPSKQKLDEVADDLMFISNNLFSPYNKPPTTDQGKENVYARNRIKIALKLYGAAKQKLEGYL